MTKFEIIMAAFSAIAGIATFFAAFVALYNANIPYRTKLEIQNNENRPPEPYEKHYDIVITCVRPFKYRIEKMSCKGRGLTQKIMKVDTGNEILSVPCVLDVCQSIHIDDIYAFASACIVQHVYSNNPNELQIKEPFLTRLKNFYYGCQKVKFVIIDGINRKKIVKSKHSIFYYEKKHFKNICYPGPFDFPLAETKVKENLAIFAVAEQCSGVYSTDKKEVFDEIMLKIKTMARQRASASKNTLLCVSMYDKKQVTEYWEFEHREVFVDINEFIKKHCNWLDSNGARIINNLQKIKTKNDLDK